MLVKFYAVPTSPKILLCSKAQKVQISQKGFGGPGFLKVPGEISPSVPKVPAFPMWVPNAILSPF